MSDVVKDDLFVGKVYGLMPKHHPILGKFVHAPCARNASSKYSGSQLITITEYEKLKRLRNNPFTGQFHHGPKSYSLLHYTYRRLKKTNSDETLSTTHKRQLENAQLKRENETISGRAKSDLEENGVMSRLEEEMVRHECFAHQSYSENNEMTGDYDRLIRKSVSWMYRGASGSRPRSRSHMDTDLEEIEADFINSPHNFVSFVDFPERRKFSAPPSKDQAVNKVNDETENEENGSVELLTNISRANSFDPRKKIGSTDRLFEKWVVRPSDQVSRKYEYNLEDSACELGNGAYSKVIAAKHRETGKACALKIIKKKYLIDKEEQEMVKREVEIHQRLKHRNIISLYETYESKANLYMVLERANNGSLEDVMASKHRLTESDACVLLSQVFDAVVYLHENGVLHADIKPANILLSYDNPLKESGKHILDVSVKLCDFGLSRKVPDVKYFKYTGDVYKAPYTNFRGTIGYIAPEILKQEAYSTSADIWSLGIITYELISGEKPFTPYKKCLTASVCFPDKYWSQISSNCIDLIKKILVREASRRLNIKHARCHPWFASNSLSLQF